MKTRYLIIGNSAAAIGAIEAIREKDAIGAITVVSDEPYPAYSRPMISKFLAHECDLSKMIFRDPDFYGRNRVTTMLGTSVTELQLPAHYVKLGDGNEISYQKLMLATGGKPIIPELDGLNGKKNIFTFTTLDDAKSIDAYLNSGSSKAVVIGGGLIGISLSEALIKRGLQVSVVEMKDYLLNTILDRVAAGSAEEQFRKSGINIFTSRTVTRINGTDHAAGVTLDNGDEIACDLLAIAIGVAPRSELAMSAGLKSGRGIKVDRYLMTSQPDVYACGDVAEAWDFIYETERVIPIWPNAYLGGRTAGFNMAGTVAQYPGGTTLNSLNYFGVEIASAGMTMAPEISNYRELISRKDKNYKKVVIGDNQVKGMVMLGDIDKSGIIYGLMKQRADISEIAERLVADDFGIADLPASLRHERFRAEAVEADVTGKETAGIH